MTATPPPDAADDRPLQALSISAERLVRGRSPDQWLLLAGALLVPAGLVAIAAGYWGASHAPRVIQQVPYEISGGLLGVALVVAGGFAYFGWWLSRIARGQAAVVVGLERQTDALVTELRAVRAALAGGELTMTAGLVRTASGSLVHRPGCSVVAGRATVPATLADGRPCTSCRPAA